MSFEDGFGLSGASPYQTFEQEDEDDDEYDYDNFPRLLLG
jgi:hypothetical protein